jgi:group I intron endonuclease
MFILYEITCCINGKKYIGYTSKSIEERFNIHLQTSNQKHKQAQISKLYRSIRKYGKESFVVSEIMSSYNKKTITYAERFYIKLYDTIKNGYNTSEGGHGGITRNEAELKKLRERMCGINNPMYGKKLSTQHKEKLNKNAKLFFDTERGKEIRQQHTRRFIENNPGKNPSIETKQKISTSKKGISVGAENWIVTTPTGEILEINNLSKFCRDNLLDQANMISVSKGRQKSSKGYKCQKSPLP